MNKLITMMLVGGLFLSGCTSKPSTSDVEKIIEASIADCSLVEVKSVTKVNGIFNDDRNYTMAVTYSLKVNPEPTIAKTKKERQQKALELSESLKQAKTKFDQAYTAFELMHSDNQTVNSSAEFQDAESNYKQLQKQYFDAATALKQFEAEPYQAFAKECYANPALNDTVLMASESVRAVITDEEPFIKGFVMKDIPGEFTFVRTDNGWMQANRKNPY